MLDAVEARDTKSARKATEAHLVDSADHVIAMFEKARLWAEAIPV